VYHYKIQYLTGAPILYALQKQVVREMPGQKTVEGRTEEPSVLQQLNAV
jgi:hypothetical protein